MLNPIIINIENINKTIFPPKPTFDKILIILSFGVLKDLIHPMPNTQYTNNKNIFKLLEAIIGKSSELLVLNSNIQANIPKINNKHDERMLLPYTFPIRLPLIPFPTYAPTIFYPFEFLDFAVNPKEQYF